MIGASEMVLSKCTKIIGEGGVVKDFTEEHKASFISDVIEPMASNGLRTICIAYRDFPKDQGEGETQSFNFLLKCVSEAGV